MVLVKTTKKYTAYTFEEAIQKWTYGEMYGKKLFEVEF